MTTQSRRPAKPIIGIRNPNPNRKYHVGLTPCPGRPLVTDEDRELYGVGLKTAEQLDNEFEEIFPCHCDWNDQCIRIIQLDFRSIGYLLLALNLAILILLRTYSPDYNLMVLIPLFLSFIVWTTIIFNKLFAKAKAHQKEIYINSRL